MTHLPPEISDPAVNNPSHSSICQRMMDLGYVARNRVNLYGEHFQVVSDPFVDGNWVAVRVRSENDPTIQTIRLPVRVLLGLANLMSKHES
jgi:hypothetical protein